MLSTHLSNTNNQAPSVRLPETASNEQTKRRKNQNRWQAQSIETA